jgi:hypothetical protein
MVGMTAAVYTGLLTNRSGRVSISRHGTRTAAHTGQGYVLGRTLPSRFLYSFRHHGFSRARSWISGASYDSCCTYCSCTHLSGICRVWCCSCIRSGSALCKDCKEWCGWLPSRMVPICLCDVSNWYFSTGLCTQLGLLSIGDWYPERNLFQILIALTSGTRL